MSQGFSNRKPYKHTSDNYNHSNKYNTNMNTTNKRDFMDKSMLSFDEQNEILENFPSNIKFSYEKSTHKKVLSDIYVIIPKGKKYFVWFTHRNRKNICIFLEIGYQNKIMNIFYRHVSFDDVLSYGTIFYGTLFRTKSKNDATTTAPTATIPTFSNEIFSVEDILYYKGDEISNYNHDYEYKLKLIKNIFDTKLRYNMAFFKNGIVFGLPIITTDFNEAYDKAHELPYAVYSIQYKYLNGKNSNQSVIEFYHFGSSNGGGTDGGGGGGGGVARDGNNIKTNNSDIFTIHATHATHATHSTHTSHNDKYAEKQPVSNEIYKNFFIKPDIQNDIYYLYQINTTNFDTISKEIAHIPDYKTSVFMNKLFRNIKENNNLDTLEESDEEEEFENIQIDKFVDLNKLFKMRCIFNYKFKKWIPVSIIE